MNKVKFVGVAAAIAAATGVASAQWSDDFDGYANGTNLHNVGGWFGWDDDPNVAGTVTNERSRSAPHSVTISNGTGNDAVQVLRGYDSGAWTLTAYWYVPSNIDAKTYFIIQNEYNHFGPYDWAFQLALTPSTGMVQDEIRGGPMVPAVFDQWVEVRLDIDLDNNTVEATYNGASVASGVWETSGFGLIEIQGIDLYSPTNVATFFDDISLEPGSGGCPADMDGDGDADVNDFFLYLDLFEQGDPRADITGDGTVDVNDFFAYLDLFAAGC